MFKSLRYRILIWFTLLAIMLVVTFFPLNYLHEKEKQVVHQSVNELNMIHVLLLQDQINIGNFISYELNNADFFLTSESDYLNKHYSHRDSIRSIINTLINKTRVEQAPYLTSLNDIATNYNTYCQIIDSIVYKTYQRGYQNYGLLGKLSSYIYQLENIQRINSNELNQIKLLRSSYCNTGSNENAKALILHTGTLLTKNNSHREIKLVLENYLQTFNHLVELDKDLGLYSVSGLKEQYVNKSGQIRDDIGATIQIAKNFQKVQLRRLNLFFGIIVVLCIIATFLYSIRTSRYLVKNLEKLNRYISHIASRGFTDKMKVDLSGSTKEIKLIYHEFRNMLAQLRIHEKMRDRALREAEINLKRYRELADLLPISIYETDEFGNLTYVNNTWYETFGYSKHDVKQGINLIEILNSNVNGDFHDLQDNNDFVAIKRNGNRFPATVFSDIIELNGKKIGHRGIIIDYSHKHQYIESLKKETLKAVKSDKYKSHFLANMSHEIRTPMNSIIGFANLLSFDNIKGGQKKEYAAHIQNSSEFLLKLIDDIIDIAKIEAGEIKIKKGACCANDLIKEVISSFRNTKLGLNKEINLIVNIPDEDISFYTDEFRLKQILTNLLSNAYKFTLRGEVNITLQKKTERRILFAVEDTGIGMTREELKTVFQRFKRSKTSEEKKIGGTGLGLAISKNLVELLGGEMWVSSEKDKGTKFCFELPFVKVPKPIPKPIDEGIQSFFNNDWSTYNILVVEDSDDNRKFINQVLKQTQINIINAANGKEAIEALNFQKSIDVILMDLQMPVLNGFDASKVIKRHYPDIPIIALSALAMESDKERALSHGCDDYLAKPIQIEKLLGKIAQYIHKRKMLGTAGNTNRTNQNMNKNKTEENISIQTSKQ